MKPKRRNLDRWKRNRLRRLRHKIKHESAWSATGYRKLAPDELARCLARASQLYSELKSL
jgi:hypothetical protein